MTKNLGVCLFVSWPTVDQVADNWAKKEHGPQAKAAVERDGTDLSVCVFCNGKTTEVDASALISAICKAHGGCYLASAKHHIAAEEGLYLIQREMSYEDYAAAIKGE